MNSKLEDRLWIWPYKMKSKSALAMADGLDIWMIKHEGSKWKGSTGRYVLNWGAGTGVFNLDIGNAKLLNTPHQIDLAVNKLDFFRACLGDKAPRLPFWTTSQQQAKAWLSNGLVVIARTKVEGAKGSGIVVMKKSLDFVPAPLYTVRTPSSGEYRVYMFNGEVLDYRVKLLAKGAEEHPDGMRYEDKYEYCKPKSTEALPGDISHQAKLAIAKIGLFTGGVDVLYDDTTGLATVLEINSAPYIGKGTADKYAEAFKDYFENEAA